MRGLRIILAIALRHHGSPVPVRRIAEYVHWLLGVVMRKLHTLRQPCLDIRVCTCMYFLPREAQAVSVWEVGVGAGEVDTGGPASCA